MLLCELIGLLLSFVTVILGATLLDVFATADVVGGGGVVVVVVVAVAGVGVGGVKFFTAIEEEGVGGVRNGETVIP